MCVFVNFQLLWLLILFYPAHFPGPELLPITSSQCGMLAIQIDRQICDSYSYSPLRDSIHGSVFCFILSAILYGILALVKVTGPRSLNVS